MGKITQQELDNIQIDYGVLFGNHGEVDEFKIGPTKGGGEFSGTANGHYIEFDGASEAEAGTFVVESVLAHLQTTVKSLSADTLMLALPYATNNAGVITVGRDNIGVVPKSKHLKNVVMFAKLVDKSYKKITIFNPLSIGGLTFTAAPKSEGEYQIKLDAHMDPTIEDESTDLLYQIEDVASIS